MPRKGRLNKSINGRSCPQLRPGAYLEKGRLVYLFGSVQCIDPEMVAVTNEPGKPPFFELPKNTIRWID